MLDQCKMSVKWLCFRRQDLRELRLLQKEEQRAQQQLNNKLQQQREQIYKRFEQEVTVSKNKDIKIWITVLLLELDHIKTSTIKQLFTDCTLKPCTVAT